MEFHLVYEGRLITFFRSKDEFYEYAELMNLSDTFYVKHINPTIWFPEGVSQDLKDGTFTLKYVISKKMNYRFYKGKLIKIVII